ncbi:MAG: transcriptional regulator [Candidatus Sericytochromatia bacterium]|nr:MAG: transcriptional regulator [Candidatus Sericytochromatia bacterium]
MIENVNLEDIQKLSKLVDSIGAWLYKTEIDEIKKSNISELTYSELHTLKAIEEIENAKLYEIADKLGVSSASMSVTIDNLEKKSFVIRDKDKNDRRAIIIRLTEKGINANREHEKLHCKMAEAILSKLDKDQQKIIVKAFEKLLSNE